MKDRFSPILRRIFLKYPHISQKIWLVYEKISSFKTASHLTANKFLMDFDATSRSQVRTLQGLARRKPLKVIAVRLISSIPLRLAVRKPYQFGFLTKEKKGGPPFGKVTTARFFIWNFLFCRNTRLQMLLSPHLMSSRHPRHQIRQAYT